MDSDIKRVQMVRGNGENVQRIFRESQMIFDTLRTSVERRIKGNDLSEHVLKEIKKIADAINLAKTLSRRLLSMIPQDTAVDEVQQDLNEGIIAALDQVFENLDIWETKWKDYFRMFKRTDDWFGPFSDDQAEEILKLRYLGYSIHEIADLLSIKNEKELEKMVGKWMTQSK